MSTAYMFDSEGPFAIEDNVRVQRALELRGIRRFDVASRTAHGVGEPIRVYAETAPRWEQVSALVAKLRLSPISSR